MYYLVSVIKSQFFLRDKRVMLLGEVEDLNDSLFANIYNRFFLWAALSDLYSVFINFGSRQLLISLYLHFLVILHLLFTALSTSCRQVSIFLVRYSMNFEEVNNRSVMALESLR